MHQHMDTGADGLERKISVEAAARYASSASVPRIPARTSISSSPSSRHQPPLPVRDPTPRTLPPPTLREPPPPAPREIITLDQVRPGPRAQNDYVDSPRWAAQPPPHPHPHKTLVHPKSLQIPGGSDRTVGYRSPSVSQGGGGSPRDPVITSQPPSAHTPALKKDHSVDIEPDSQPPPIPCQDSIICSQCGKCRCQACTQPRELPRRWLCNNKCECSAQKLVDVCSCLCCVRACFYHCFKDSEGDECSASDDPCACCERPHCCKRWTCLGIMSLCLPCLCFYWPLRCGLSCCTSVYNKCSRRGCHCRRDKLPGSKRLLIDSESSST